jgi:hypothetical protein
MNCFNHVALDRDLLLEFFLTFSRFEYALKASGFVLPANKRKDDPEGRGVYRILIDWDRFVREEIDGRLVTTTGTPLEQAINYFTDNPPLMQVLADNTLSWSSTAPDPDISLTIFLSEMIRRVRNNLFHGGKFSQQHHEEVDRTTRLLQYSLVILGEFLALSPQVKEAYEDAELGFAHP